MAEGAKVHHQSLQEEGLVNNLSEEERNEVLNSLDARLGQAGKAKLSQYLTQEEVEEAIKDLPEGKSPGIDGIPHELWKHLTRVYESDKKIKKTSLQHCEDPHTNIQRHREKRPGQKLKICKGLDVPYIQKRQRDGNRKLHVTNFISFFTVQHFSCT